MKVAQFIKHVVIIFLVSFFLNAVWEIVHSTLYVHYKGGPITSLILLQAMFVDAGLICGLFIVSRLTRQNMYAVMVVGGLLIAILLELWALKTNRWAYATTMPLVPLLHTGLTPTIQLVLTGGTALWLSKRLLQNI